MNWFDDFALGDTVEKVNSRRAAIFNYFQAASGRKFSMQWNRSNTIGLAKNTCSFCHGHGMRVQYKIKQSPCGCVFRSVFRACLRRFRECAISESYASTVTWDYYAAGG